MARKGENIYHRKDGRWEGRYIKGRGTDGKLKFGSVYGRQYGEVKRKLIQIKAERYGITEKPEIICGDGSFQSWMEYWLEIQARPFVRPGTYDGYRRIIENHLTPLLGEEALQKITQEKIQAAVEELRKKLASSTLHGVCRLLKAILTAAQKKGLIRCNPYHEIKLPKWKTKTPRVLSAEEQKKLEKKILGTEELEYLLCLYTGLRVGEVCALRWEDIDLESGLLFIRHSVKRISSGNSGTCLSLGTPKSESSRREIPLPSFLLELLGRRREKTGGSGFVFPGAKGICRDPRTLQKRLGKIGEELEIEGIHMHTLRHTFATRCLERNVRYEILSELLGHSSPQMTLRYYAHCTMQSKRESIDRLDRPAGSRPA